MEGKLGIAVFVVLCLTWQVQATVTCTAAGRFADTDDTTCKNYTLCVALTNGSFVGYSYVCPTTSLFSPTLSLCTTDYVCNVTSDTTDSTTDTCTAEGYFADTSSTNCTTYIECVSINGTYVESTYTCPDDTYFNPNTTLCDASYNCTQSFTCSSAGRFADTSDTTCQDYYLCVAASNGTIISYKYTCPCTSVFNPTTSVCSTSYTCTTS